MRNRWRAASGYREVLIIAIPMILSSGAISIQHFVDRMFLTWYSPEAVAAAMPAGMVKFAASCLFMGTAMYAGTFVAQYYGAEQHERIGPVLWHGAYIGIFGGCVSLALMPLAPRLFSAIGHGPVVESYETQYFQMLCLGSIPWITSSALSGFYSGRGKTWVIMVVNVSLTCLNIVLDYLLIFGKFGLPEMGVKGAALATTIAGWCSLTTYACLMLRKAQDAQFNTRGGWRPRKALLLRLIRFGLPSGVQFFIDIASFTTFILLIGRLGTRALAATNIAFNINSLAFMPMFGFGVAVSVEVGKYIGKGEPDLAEKSVYSGVHLGMAYMLAISLAYVLIPSVFLAPFAMRADPVAFEPIRKTTVVLLRFVALYCLCDAMAIIFSSAIKGAGDTRFVMLMILALSTTCLVIPSYVALVIFDGGLYAGWWIVSIYVIILGFSFMARFLGGKWKSMKVIEEVAPALPPNLPEAPITEREP